MKLKTGEYNLRYHYVVMLFCMLYAAQVSAQTWQKVPIRTSAQQAGGFSGGEGFQAIQKIEYAPSNPNILYAMSDVGGVWKGTDDGTKITWNPMLNGYTLAGGMSLTVHPTNPDIVLVAGCPMTIGQPSPSGSLQGIVRTTDGGLNWSLVKTAQYRNARVNKGANLFVFAGGTTVYAGTYGDGILKSTDTGATWSTLLASPSIIYDIKKHPSDSTKLYACTSDGLYRIDNANTTPTLTKIGLTLPQYPIQIAIDYTTPTTMYVTAYSSGVYRSTDGGTNFSARNNGMSAILSAGKRAYCIVMSPADPNYLYVSYDHDSNTAPWGYYYSHDGGANWYAPASMDVNGYLGSLRPYFGQVKGHNYVTSTAVHPTNKNVAITLCSGEQLRRTTDGGVYWTYCNDGFIGGVLGSPGVTTTIGFDSASKFMFFVNDWGPYYTSDGGSTWSPRPTYGYITLGWGATTAGTLVPGTDIAVVAGGDWALQRLAVSRDVGLTWTQLLGTDDTYQFVKNHPTNQNVVYAGKYKFTSILSNNNYTTLSKEVTGMYRGNGDIVYSWGYSGGTVIVYKSTDGGASWTAPYPSIPANGSIGQMDIAPNDPDRIYLAMKNASTSTNNGIWIISDIAADGGTAVVKNSSHGLSNDALGYGNWYSVAVDPNNPNVVYASQYWHHLCSENGVFRSTDYGATWQSIAGNLAPNHTANNITVNPFDSYVYIGTFIGTWKLSPPDGGEPPPPPGGLSHSAIKTGTTTVTVDGILTDWISMPNSLSNTIDGATSATYAWNVMWKDGTAGGLYFAIQATDSSQYNTLGTSTLYLGDGVEIYIDRDNNKGTFYDSYDRQIGTGYGSGTSIFVSAGATTGILVSGSNTAGGTWTKEMFIPWSLFPGGLVPTPGTIIGFNVQGNDRDIGSSTRKGAKGWNGEVNDYYYNPSSFGEILLSGTTTTGTATIPSSQHYAHWKLDETSGNDFADSSGNNRNGTVTGAIATSTAKYGYCRWLDGLDDFLTAPNITIGVTSTVSLWFKTQAGSPGAWGQIIGDAFANAIPFTTESDTWIGGYWAGATQRAVSIISTNIWYHYVFSSNGGTVTYYRNGVADGTKTAYPGFSGTAYIGELQGGSDDYKGYIDDLRVWSTALSADQVMDLYTIPTITNGTAINISVNSATITGTGSTGGNYGISNYLVKYGTQSGIYTGTSTEEQLAGSTSSTFNWTLSSLPGSTTIYYQLVGYDAYGTVSATEQSFNTLATDVMAPIGTVSINSADTYATSTGVILTLTATDATGITAYFPSEGSSTPYATQTGWFDIETTTSYSDSKPFSVSNGDGTKTVNVWYKDGSGNISSKAQDSIVLDTVFASIVIGTPTASCNLYTDGSKVYGTSGTSINLSGIAYDVNGVQQVKISNSATSTVNTATGTETWTMSNLPIIGTLADNIFSATGFDVAGNQGTDTIHIGAFPVPETGEALAITRNSATLTGTVTINDAGTTAVCFDYGAAVYNESTGEYEGYEAGSYPGSSSTQTISGTSVTDGLVFWAKLDETSGNAVDITSGNVGTRTGALQNQAGRINRAYYFDGVDDGVNFGDPTDGRYDFGTDSFSVSFWGNRGTTTFSIPISKGAYNNPGYDFYWRPENIEFLIHTPDNYGVSISANVPINEWHHFVGVCTRVGTGTQLNGYYDSIPNGESSTGTVSLSNSHNLEIGQSAVGGFYLMGKIDDVRIYNRVLSNAEVLAIYNEGISGRQASVSIQLANLTPNTQYRYRLVGENDIGKTYALTEGEFTTLAGIGLPANHINYRGWYKSSQGVAWLKSQGLWIPFQKNVRSSKDWQELLANPSEYLGDLH